MKVIFNRINILLLLLVLGSALMLPGAAFCGGGDDDGGRVAAEKRFKDNNDGTVSDVSTGLMWAAKDNGGDMNWADAEMFCKNYTAGGYSDWRLPSLGELKNLYDAKQKKVGQYGITSLITLSECCAWTSVVNLNAAAVFSFRTGHKPWSFLGDDYQLRVLPVRGKPADPSVNAKAFTGR